MTSKKRVVLITGAESGIGKSTSKIFLDNGYKVICTYLKNNNKEVSPFSEGITSFQVRYKYEIAPLSYIYLVYTKGGSVFEDNITRETSKIFKDPWKDPDNEIFSIKFRLKY